MPLSMMDIFMRSLSVGDAESNLFFSSRELSNECLALRMRFTRICNTLCLSTKMGFISEYSRTSLIA